MAAMESTGSYWKPLYNVLEASGMEAMVVNAHHMKAVPGRKTDVQDAEWIADLLQHGLLQPSYIPDKAQRELRELVGYRKSLVRDKTAELNRLQKMLEGANIKLSGTVADINGKSVRNILDIVQTGEELTVAKLGEMREKKLVAANLKATDAQLAVDLNGVMTPLQYYKKIRLAFPHGSHASLIHVCVGKAVFVRSFSVSQRFHYCQGTGLPMSRYAPRF